MYMYDQQQQQHKNNTCLFLIKNNGRRASIALIQGCPVHGIGGSEAMLRIAQMEQELQSKFGEVHTHKVSIYLGYIGISWYSPSQWITVDHDS